MLTLLLMVLPPLLRRCGASSVCEDNDTMLKQALATHPLKPMLEMMIPNLNCAALKQNSEIIKSRFGKKVCEVEEVKRFCVKTCGLPCSQEASTLPCVDEPQGIDHLLVSKCKGTKDNDIRSDFTCQDGYTAHGSLQCNDGIWAV